ncbi:hypothetical protein COCMIDRAFT_108324 [Bipolaris oryzae ATCC 44560]|uniref:3-hydroxyacyl-CoA dehydrogenase n=1 Tax=Bipolaris oryzae ATCC 44560 TaxID=930090 RepID=W6YSL8_COCMI|nr:uncharacterized protein COCMIDRAFT_108324 [Bipolaris oryzae ATCC 44560]EUC40620.1 hypothetical protein COCMIDRAFT_108324 [Bipolaris oryzae ATCC 44560]
MPHSTTSVPVQHITVIGSGSIGASWAALFLAQGLKVTAFDINPAAEATLRKLVKNALPVLKSLGLLKNPNTSPEDITFTTDLAIALKDADFVQENGPERLDLKQQLFNNMAALVRHDTIIATSSSGLTCTSIQSGMGANTHPERIVIGHPFNPPHLIPLVEVVGGEQTAPETIERTMAFYTAIGKKAVHVKKEVVGHIANRLQAALMREMLHMVQNDICSISDIDDVMAYGPGLRWGIMGPNALFHLAGGEQGAQHMANHLLGPLTTWWAQKDPVLDDDLRKKWVQGTIEAVDERKFDDLVTQRDSELVRLLNLRNDIILGHSTPHIMPSVTELPQQAPSKQRLYILDASLSSPNFTGGCIVSCNTDGSDLQPVVSPLPTLPDGVTIDRNNGIMWWTNMGSALSTNTGSIETASIDGSNRRTIVPTGTKGVWTPKQITLAKENRTLYWCDREGMKVMRMPLATEEPEVLISTGDPYIASDAADTRNWCVGIAVDERRGWFYWTQKGASKGNAGAIYRARIDNTEVREKVFENLPEPIDLELDEENAVLYWTDRGDPPRGNTLNRAFVGGGDEPIGEIEILASRFHETIGLTLDLEKGIVYVSDLAGGVYAVDLQTRKKKVLFPELGDLTGIALL